MHEYADHTVYACTHTNCSCLAHTFFWYVPLANSNLVLLTDAAYRFYRSKKEENSMKRRGKTVEVARQKRVHERLCRVSTNILARVHY